jgi:maltose O-acetyltransferase
MNMQINKKTVHFLNGIPPKNKLLMMLLYLKIPLFVPFIKKYVKRKLRHCDKIDFFPGFMFYYGNIYARNVSFNDTFILDYAPVYIGENTYFAWNNMIITSSHDINNINNVIAKPVVIGKNVFVGSRCVIIGGVTIGDNSIIASGSVVAKDIPPNCLAGGNPAKFIKNIDRKTKI